jgi:hypothetical protein
MLSEQELPSPPFLSAEDRADAAREVFLLQAIPGLPTALRPRRWPWLAKAHWGTSARWTCWGLPSAWCVMEADDGNDGARSSTVYLQQRHPNSEWAKR